MLNFSGAPAHTFGAPAVRRPPLRDDGARSRRPFLTWRRPGCPLKCGLGAPVFAWPALWSLPPGAPSAGAKNTFAPSPHNRSHPWRVWRAINRA